MKTISAADLKTNMGEFFDTLLRDGEVTVTRNGKSFPLKLIRDKAAEVEAEELPDSTKLVDAMFKFAESIPDEKRELVGQAMLETLGEHREEVNKERRARMVEKAKAKK